MLEFPTLKNDQLYQIAQQYIVQKLKQKELTEQQQKALKYLCEKTSQMEKSDARFLVKAISECECSLASYSSLFNKKELKLDLEQARTVEVI